MHYWRNRRRYLTGKPQEKLFATKIRRQQGQKLPTHYMLNNNVQDPNRNKPKEFPHIWKSRPYYQQSINDVTLEVKGARIN
jgi:hypothetical protein